LELHRSNRRDEAAEKLAKSLGGEKATEPISGSLEKIFDKDSLIHDAVLDTVANEAKRRKR